jgi:hypothetical protein
MTYPSRKKLTEYPIVTPTLADSVVNIQGNTVKRSTLQSILDLFGAPVLPYKVFTGLLTQSGGANFIDWFAGPLTKGVTYKIYGNGGDYSNVGAPNNNDGTYFIATSNEVPTSYNGTFVQYDEGAPTCIILENTLGDFWFTYNAGGSYSINSNDLFNLNKTIGFITFNDSGQYGVVDLPILALAYNLSLITINTSITQSFNDSVLYNTPIEIRVYN